MVDPPTKTLSQKLGGPPDSWGPGPPNPPVVAPLVVVVIIIITIITLFVRIRIRLIQ